MSLPPRGAWIEILHHFRLYEYRQGRSPHGERGLKYYMAGKNANKQTLLSGNNLEHSVHHLEVISVTGNITRNSSTSMMFNAPIHLFKQPSNFHK